MRTDAEVQFNESAQFLPAQPGSDDVPALMVAGVLVLVYVEDGRLVIRGNFDESELGDPTPVSVMMSGKTVWES